MTLFSPPNNYFVICVYNFKKEKIVKLPQRHKNILITKLNKSFPYFLRNVRQFSNCSLFFFFFTFSKKSCWSLGMVDCWIVCLVVHFENSNFYNSEWYFYEILVFAWRPSFVDSVLHFDLSSLLFFLIAIYNWLYAHLLLSLPLVSYQ